MHLSPYFNFNGNCQEALDWYAQAFNGKVSELHLYSESQEMCSQIPEQWQNKIMHASFSAGNIFFMASDAMPEGDYPCSNAELSAASCPISLSLNFDSETQQAEVFSKLATGGHVTMALADTFWGARFGMLTDKFGIKWMFNCDKPKT